MGTRYMSNGSVKPEICLVPPPPQHYRMMAQRFVPGTEGGYQINTSGNYVQQQPNQPGNQGPQLRSLPPNGSPNQASTPPTNELKVQSVQQHPNHMQVFSQQPGVQRGQGHYYNRNSTGPPGQQTSRMPNHQQRNQQPIYQAQTQFTMPTLTATPVYAPVPQNFYAPQRPTPQSYVTPFIVPASLPNSAFYSFGQNSAVYNYPYNIAMNIPRSGHPQQNPTATPPNTSQPLPNIPMNQPPPPQAPFPRQRPRTNAVTIVNPDTMEPIDLSDVTERSDSHPPSGESSARQTPQPAPPNKDNNIIPTLPPAAFEYQPQPPPQQQQQQQQQIPQQYQQHPQQLHQQQPPAPAISIPPPQPNRIDNILQSSKLTPQAKEFISNSSSNNNNNANSTNSCSSNSLQSAKETTPVVSANTDAVEVTLPKKERESPAKIKKQHLKEERQQLQQREHKESLKETTTTSVVSSSTVNNKEDVAGVVKDTKKDDNKLYLGKDDKKRKDSKNVETKFNSIESSEIVGSAPVETCTAKSKQNASQRANKQHDSQKQQSVNQQKQQSVPPVPQPQPPKPNNKTNRKQEINQRGAGREGSDMDAFNNDNLKLDAINANVNNNDVINANSLEQTTTNTSSSTTPTTQNINNEKKIINELNSNNVTTIKQQQNAPVVAPTATPSPTPTPTPTPPTAAAAAAPTTKTKKVVNTSSDIGKEKPKELKPPPIVSAPVESQDETDKAVISNDKLVQAKNEANTKASETQQSVIDSNKSDINYSKDQWAPNNPEGKKIYGKEFLLALRDNPSSKRKPDGFILDAISVEDGKRISEGRHSMGGRSDFTPQFMFGGKSSSQQRVLTKRNSQSGKVVGNGSKSNKAQPKLHISVKGDVKLNETENAWRPARFVKGENMSDEDKKTEELYRRVRGVLNRLTPQKFDTLIGQVRALQIDTEDRLQGVIDLVFEKAVDEPNFSVAYAFMCKELCYMAVPAATSTVEKPENVNFRKLLVTRCQYEFEKQSVDESVRNEKLREIEDCTDPEKKKELQFDLGEYDRRLRMKSVGNIRFIGELFKQQMLTVNIMIRCLHNLLDNKDEESLECLCKLLTTIGKELEGKGVNLSNIFSIMREIVDRKHGAVSSRVRFMLCDVMDLKKGKWVPRRQDANPKTIDQIQKEADHEQFTIQTMNSMPLQSRKDERGGGGGGGGGGGTAGSSADRKRGTRNVSDDGWQTQSRNNNRTQFLVQSDKLKSKAPLTDEPLGGKAMFSSWSKGSAFKTGDAAGAPTNTANMYAALENMDTEKRSIGSRSSLSKEGYSSKGPSLERPPHSKTSSYNDGRGSRSGSQHRSNESSSSISSQRSTPSSTISQQQQQLQQQPQLPTPASVQQTISKPPQQVNQGGTTQMTTTASIKQLSEEQLERRVQNDLDEFLNDSCTIDEYNQDTIQCVPVSYHSRMVADGFLHVLERSSTARLKTGFLFAELIRLGTISLESYCVGLEEILSQADDLIIDIPKFWDYLTELLVSEICNEALPLKRLQKCFETNITDNNNGKILLERLFHKVITEKGPAFLQKLWQQSGLQLSDFMLHDQVDSFIKNNKFDFLCGGDTMPIEKGQLTYEHIHSKLIEFFKSKHTLDDIFTWITANVGDRISENKFIRTLATAIFEFASVNNKLAAEQLKQNYSLLMKYVDNKPEYELQCLFALQTFINKLEHPQGLLLSICELIYEDGVFSQDSFIAWETNADPAEQEAKGVAIKQLTSFFTQLKENEEDESEEDEEET